MSTCEKQILSLTPADHWFAVYKDEDGSWFVTPLAVWAVVRESERGGTFDYVVGIDMNGEGATGLPGEVTNFVRFAHESDFNSALELRRARRAPLSAEDREAMRRALEEPASPSQGAPASTHGGDDPPGGAL